jgi:predicted ATPase/DNA-binding SARP family transcriptional activator
MIRNMDGAKTPASHVLSIALLGAPFAEREGKLREFLPERRYELLVHLACRGTWVSRDALAFMFWPDQDNSSARRNLRFVLHSARALPEFGAIEAERDRIRLNALTDVHRFEAAVRDERWPDAVALYRGALCSGFDAEDDGPFAQWLRSERGRLAEMFHRAAMALIETSEPALAAALARRLIDDDPSDEEALRACLHALRELNQVREARSVYRAFSERLLDELGLEPSAESRALIHEIEAPPSGAAPATAVHSTFVGRARELAEIAALLSQPECRLLTLIGPGGVGKSRLAREALAAQHGMTVAFVPLEDLTVPSQLAGEVARAIGLRLTPRDDPAAQVQAQLAKRPHLLVLDNFEHLIDAGDQLDRWLSACPGLRAIVTSRERLGIAGEWLQPVEGLGIPRPDDPDIRTSDAVRLFVERASAAKRDFDWASERAGIASIVAQVDGMPLAIELAAAWTRLLPCADIARDIAGSLELLETASSARAELRSVRASFEHSWSLLTARERALFSKLSVFRGGFDRDAARQVADGPLIAIAQLVDKSLVRADGAGRFVLHPLLQQFASEKLAQDAGAEERTRVLHAEYFAHRLARSRDNWHADREKEAAAIRTELDNCLAAWRFALTQRRFDLVEMSCVALSSFFRNRDLPREGLEVLALTDAEPELKSHNGLAFAHVNVSKADLLLYQGNSVEADTYAHVALKHFRLARNDAGVSRSLIVIGESLWVRGLLGKARPYFELALKQARASGDLAGLSAALSNVALLASAEGRHGEAMTLFDESVRLYRETGDAAGLATALNNLGHLCLLTGDFERARAYLRDGLEVCERMGLELHQSFFLLNMSIVEFELGRPDVAQVNAENALRRVRAGGNRLNEALCLCWLARITAARGEPGAANVHLTEAAQVARRNAQSPDRLSVATCFAYLLGLRGEWGGAATILMRIQGNPVATESDQRFANRELVALRDRLSSESWANATLQAPRVDLERLIDQIADRGAAAATL